MSVIYWVLFAKHFLMEGPTRQEKQPASAEQLTEAIEVAHELYSELRSFDGLDLKGAHAIATKDYIENLALELKEALKDIPPFVCMMQGLPYHPTDEKNPVARTPFPAQPDYPLSYPVAANDNHGPEAIAA